VLRNGGNQIKVCNNSPSNLYLFQDRKNLDVSCAGQNLIGRKRELTTTGVKPWMHRKKRILIRNP
jgi:hypothetical protein